VTVTAMAGLQSKLVSAIIPCYNQAHFLGDSIASVLNQTYTNHEVIVVDDGSTDDTLQVAARYSQVRCIRKRNGGLAAARNTGLRAGAGDYVVFIDADDRLLPDAFEAGVNSLEADPSCAMVYGHVRLIDAAGEPLSTPEQTDMEGDHYLELLRQNFIWTLGTVMYRRLALDAVGDFSVAINAAADYELNLRIARSLEICCLDQVVLEYRKHETNMSDNYGLMLKHSIAALRAQEEYVYGKRLYESALGDALRGTREYYGEKMVGELRSHINTRQWKRAAASMTLLLRHYPQGVARRAGRELFRVLSKVVNVSG